MWGAKIGVCLQIADFSGREPSFRTPHVLDVGFDGRVADDERRGDLGVREAGSDQFEDLRLSWG
jgi:hypothetical protein